MAKVFISYARVDDTYASEISSALAEFGHMVYSDTLLIPGAPWENALDRALRESDVLVSIITPQSNTSAFVLTELGAGLSFSRESGRMLVVPVVVGEAEIPAPLRGIQAIFDATGDKARQVAADIAQAISAFVGSRAAAEQKQEETRQRIEKNAAEYVDEAVRAQRTAEKRYRILGLVWYALGLLGLLGGLAFVAISITHITLPAADWTKFAYISLRTVVAIAILAACAKYAFALGRSFTIESLKCADRLHAISFGKFYLQVYGEHALWQDVKEAFANWNIDRPSAFVDTKASDFDPNVIELVSKILQAIKPSSDNATK